ncbi:UNVERIFIED_CONTAM: hypothetical protein Sindi_2363200 [Sesamum indicum]
MDSRNSIPSLSHTSTPTAGDDGAASDNDIGGDGGCDNERSRVVFSNNMRLLESGSNSAIDANQVTIVDLASDNDCSSFTERAELESISFNFSEFLKLAHTVIDSSDLQSMEALREPKHKWTARFGEEASKRCFPTVMARPATPMVNMERKKENPIGKMNSLQETTIFNQTASDRTPMTIAGRLDIAERTADVGTHEADETAVDDVASITNDGAFLHELAADCAAAKQDMAPEFVADIDIDLDDLAAETQDMAADVYVHLNLTK